MKFSGHPKNPITSHCGGWQFRSFVVQTTVKEARIFLRVKTSNLTLCPHPSHQATKTSQQHRRWTTTTKIDGYTITQNQIAFCLVKGESTKANCAGVLIDRLFFVGLLKTFDILPSLWNLSLMSEL